MNIVCPQGAYPYQSEKLTKCTSDDSCRGTVDSRCFGISLVHAIPSSSYNLPVQLKHTNNYVLARALIQRTNTNSLSIHT
ncbi:unnamed protein product [Hymenolepis diminuta]|uniref:Uncharacterized protein n=1 Tax=Hymenolepis diminuta TaxID=6216 RepID=A0A564Z4G3_HYMDI|nr:unnamed protein product [Hymenolepis diminuta]